MPEMGRSKEARRRMAKIAASAVTGGAAVRNIPRAARAGARVAKRAWNTAEGWFKTANDPKAGSDDRMAAASKLQTLIEASVGMKRQIKVSMLSKMFSSKERATEARARWARKDAKERIDARVEKEKRFKRKGVRIRSDF